MGDMSLATWRWLTGARRWSTDDGLWSMSMDGWAVVDVNGWMGGGRWMGGGPGAGSALRSGELPTQG